MKILWMCSVPMPEAAEIMGLRDGVTVSWIVGLSNQLKEKVDLNIAFLSKEVHEVQEKAGENITYYAIPQKSKNFTKYDIASEEYYKDVILSCQPDLIQVWGTESIYALTITNVCKSLGLLDRLIIAIQGLSSIIARHYYADLPFSLIHKYSIRDLYRRDSIFDQKRKYANRGKYEQQTLMLAKNVIGRTTWDYACTNAINPQIKYFACNEILRNSFYTNQWSYDGCEKYSIFVSQAGYPVKGFHYLLQALPEIVKRFPEVQVYVSGSGYQKDTWKNNLKLTAYQLYIMKMMKKNNLQDRIHFVGVLNEQEMVERFMKSHVFVSLSTIENESNSLSEAKILGVPVIASYVGGVVDRINHGEDGFLYQHNATYMLSFFIMKLFQDKELCVNMSEHARRNALQVNDKNENVKQLMNIYHTLYDDRTLDEYKER